MRKRVAHPIEVKNKVIELKLSGMTIKEITIEPTYIESLHSSKV